MTRRYELTQVDVFTDTPLKGNPLAVVFDADTLTDQEMQAIAREMNLSETTFVLPADQPEADYRVRIFTPAEELPFAGHPTVGTAHAMLESGRIERPGEAFTLRQQTIAGIQAIDVALRADGRDYLMTQPTPEFRPGPDAGEIAGALRVDKDALIGDPLTVSVGVAWHVAELRDLDTIASLEPDMSALTELETRTKVAVTVFADAARDPDCRVHVRSFAPGSGIPEDPVCGSGNGCVAAFIARSGRDPLPLAYRSEQGSEVGRPGRLDVRVAVLGTDRDTYRVQVGGRAVTLLDGALHLPTTRAG